MAWLEMHAKEWNENNKEQVKMEILSCPAILIFES